MAGTAHVFGGHAPLRDASQTPSPIGRVEGAAVCGKTMSMELLATPGVGLLIYAWAGMNRQTLSVIGLALTENRYPMTFVRGMTSARS